MAHAYNPSYSGDRDQKDHSSRTACQSKRLARPHLNRQDGYGGHTCNSNYTGSIGRRIFVQGQPWAKIQHPKEKRSGDMIQEIEHLPQYQFINENRI
jgi:hypothetical protein